MTYLLLLAAGGLCLMLGWRTSDEIYRIAGLVGGALFCLWGTAIAPPALQLLLELLLVISVFSVCVRCLEKGNSKHH
ncbi:MAG: hypothetical protein F6K28_50420 [Microcoleus sp. SIO2G3]|nr:hypothetical protein [Microcoleus sp. SIO2G3]